MSRYYFINPSVWIARLSRFSHWLEIKFIVESNRTVIYSIPRQATS
jgi:hypothetical protein